MPDAHQDGISMLPALRGKDTKRRTIYWHFPHRGNPSSAVIDGEWKLIHRIEAGTYELFNLKADPRESKNVIDKHPDIAARLKKRLAHIMESPKTRP